jgi:predicted transcriptional regulator
MAGFIARRTGEMADDNKLQELARLVSEAEGRYQDLLRERDSLQKRAREASEAMKEAYETLAERKKALIEYTDSLGGPVYGEYRGKQR